MPSTSNARKRTLAQSALLLAFVVVSAAAPLRAQRILHNGTISMPPFFRVADPSRSFASSSSSGAPSESTATPTTGASPRTEMDPPQPPIPTAEQPKPYPPSETLPDAPSSSLLAAEQAAAANAGLHGSVLDVTGASIGGARVVLRSDADRTEEETLSGEDGSFAFHHVTAGSFTITVFRNGFATQTVRCAAVDDKDLEIPAIIISVEGNGAQVQVTASLKEIATEQLHMEEKQRVLGIFPNFYVSYMAHAAPLSPGQKFHLANRFIVDPVNIALVGVSAGVEQATDTYSGYGGGASGYGKRFAAGFASGAIGTELGGAVLPILFHQDPRYFWKGTGSVRSRIGYAISRVVICKGDNGRWQPNYSSILGNLATAGISNAYYPESDRNGAGLTVGNALLGTATGAIANLYEEFFSRRMTPHLPSHDKHKSE